MTIQAFIEKAIEGGWKENMEIDKFEVQPIEHVTYGNPDFNDFQIVELYHADQMWTRRLSSFLLDPDAWRAVGRTERTNEIGVLDKVIVEKRIEATALKNMHRMVDFLADDGTIEGYLETL